MGNDRFEGHDIRDFILKENKAAAYFQSVERCLRREKQVLLFGAGMGGKRTFDFMKRNDLEDRCVCFIDNNPRKQGTSFCGLPVLRLDAARENWPDGLVVVSCGEGDVIRDQCIENGIPAERIYIPDLTQTDDELGNDSGEGDFRFIWKNMAGFSGCYGILEDERSKQVLVNLMNYRISHRAELIREVYDPFRDQYFDKGLVHFSGDETVLDCGAYIGDTLERLLEFSDFKDGAIHCFETDAGNYEVLKEYTNRIPKSRIFCHRTAVWNRKDMLTFNAVGSGSGFVSGTPLWSDTGGYTMSLQTASTTCLGTAGSIL